MKYDGLVLAAVAAELRRTVLRGRIQKVGQHSAADLTLEIRAPGRSYLLFLSVDARFPRVYLTASTNPVPAKAPNFCMLLRKYLGGAFLAGIKQVGFDRILRLRFDSSEHGELLLIHELMGKHSNLILTNAEGRILGAAKHIGSSVSRYRQVLPGRDYLPPPGGDKLDFRLLDQVAFNTLWQGRFREQAGRPSAAKWLIETFSGFGPFLAEEVLARGGNADPDAVFRELTAFAQVVRDESFAPVFVTNESGQDVMVYPIRSAQFPETWQHERASVSEALDALFRSLLARSVMEDERRLTLGVIRRAVATRKQTLKSIQRTLAESERADEYRRIGEILLANVHAIPSGARTVSLVDFCDPDGREIEIELDERLSPQQNAARCFKRYRKSRDAASTARARLQRIERELAVLEAARADAESGASVDSLAALRKMLTDEGFARPELQKAVVEDEFAGQRIRRVMTPEGWEILYGETAQANDHLTLRVARPDDVWLHARQITGAHVIIRTGGRKAGVPHSVLLQAATIAAANSDAKHSSLVPVDHTLRKHVRKPRAAPPGFVTYRNEKTIDISPNTR